jgi:phosphatidylglycerophosphatase C
VVERTPLTLAPDKLLEELSSMLGETDPSKVVMAFDGDGTLWSGDVGEDLFHAAIRKAFLLEHAESALLAEVERYGIELGGARGANAVANRLMGAYLAGEYPERETCAMMCWCFAGRRPEEVDALSRSVLEEVNLVGRLTPELVPVLEWAQKRAIRCVLISASPRAIVEPAGRLWGFEAADVSAATPAVRSGLIVAELAAPVPYAEAKLSAAQGLFGKARWLATFGDNVFDIEMLQAAELGVAVRPKPKLKTELAALGLRVLAPVER